MATVERNSKNLDRPPRIQPHIPGGEIEIPPPPKDNMPQQSMIEMLLPLVSIIGYLLVSVTGAGRNLFLMLPMAATMIITVSMALWRYSQARKNIEAKRIAYAQRLDDLRHQMLNYHQIQRNYYLYTFPDVNTSIGIAKTEEHSRSGPRVWERRTHEQDFGMLRLGIGTLPSTVTYKVNATDNDENPQMDEALRIAEASKHVSDIPITLLMYQQVTGKEDSKSEVRSSLGIYTQQSTSANPITQVQPPHSITSSYIKALLVHFTTFHSPRDARLYIVGSKAALEKRSARWSWAEELPHCRAGKNDVLLCFEGEEVRVREKYVKRLPLFWKDLRNELLTRQQRLQEKDSGAGGVRLPFILVIVDMLEMPEDSVLKDVEIEQTVSMIMQQGHILGASIIFLTDRADKVPSECQAIIELQQTDVETVVFRYAEVGVNARRYVGKADLIINQNLVDFAVALGRFQMRLSVATALAARVDLLELAGVNSIDEITILENWKRSRESKNKEDWPRVKIGLQGANEDCELVFSATEAGVHGAIAGTTGSGKSELLLTIIVGLAINYDPSIVNFVLVDFKGGAAFKEFESLPHCVDIVTNIDENGVERMFQSIKAELDRRGAIIANTKVKHIIEYRALGYHRDGDSKEPFPNLFIIIDEFAEMIANKPEFKAQLDSITRLGRAIGVSLLLAAQRPAGAITDQMRANIKFRICLRVETPDDSREILGRTDAAYLPPSIPGRGYLQIGNEPPNIIQVARAGAPYRRGIQKAEVRAVRWLTREVTTDASTNETISTALVKLMNEYQQREGLPRQKKPWPDPLPRYLPLDWPVSVEHMSDPDRSLLAEAREVADDEKLALNAFVSRWLENDYQHWQPVKWSNTSQVLRTNIGVIDHPRAARQRVLSFSLTDGHIAIFGGAGWGKTNFLRTLIVGLAAVHPPNDLQVYILDFGGRQLELFKNMPHTGNVIFADDSERVERLLRILNDEVTRRKQRISTVAPDFVQYNSQASISDRLPAILLVIDNFAVMRETYEHLEQPMISLLRDGRAMGVYCVATGMASNAMPPKIFALFQQTLTLYISDASEYMNIVGRSAVLPAEIPGRGLVRVPREVSPTALEMQIASPVGLLPEELVYDETDEVDELGQPLKRWNEQRNAERLGSIITPRLTRILNRMKEAWGQRPRPSSIERLPQYIYARDETWNQLPDEITHKADAIYARVGVEDRNLKTATIELKQFPHFIIVGPPTSGKTTFLQTWILSLANRYSPTEAAFVLVDPQAKLTNYGGRRSLDELPHVLSSVTDSSEFTALLTNLHLEYESKRDIDRFPHPHLFVFIDSYDEITDLFEGRNKDKPLEDLARMALKYPSKNLHFILCGSEDIAKGSDPFKRKVMGARYGFALMSVNGVELLSGKVTSAMRNMQLPVGRGYRVNAGQPTLVQIATYEPPEDLAVGRADLLDVDVNRIQEKHHKHVYRWYAEEMRDNPELDLQTVPPETSQIATGAESEPQSDEDVTNLLTPQSLSLLPADLVARLGITFHQSITPNQLSTLRPHDIQALINHGKIQLPAYLEIGIEREVRNALIARANQEMTILNGENLKKLPLEILERLGIDFSRSVLTLHEIFSPVNKVSFIQQLIDEGTIKLPSELPADLQTQINVILGNLNHKHYQMLKISNIKKLPVAIVKQLNIDFRGYCTPETLPEKDENELQRLIDDGTIALPQTYDTDLFERVSTIVANLNSPAYTYLNCLDWQHMPTELIAGLKIRFLNSGLTSDSLNQCDPQQVQQFINEGIIKIPGNITPDIISHLEKIPKWC